MKSTIFLTPFLSVHPEVVALLRGVGNTARWLPEGEHFSITIDDRYGARKFMTPWKPLSQYREVAEGYLSPSYRPRFRRDTTWFNYALLRDGVTYLASMKIVPRLPKGALVLPSPAVQARLLLQMVRKRVQSKIYRRLGSVNVPRSTTLRPASESKSVTYNDIVEGKVGTYFFTSTPRARVAYTRQWTGVRTPNFGRLVAAQLPVNPHTVKIQETPTDFTAEWEFTDNTNWRLRSCESTIHYILPPEPTHLTYARFKALRRLINTAQLGIDANLAQDFAQLGQTTRLIGDNAYRIVGSLSALKHGNVLKAANILWHGKGFKGQRRGFSFSSGPKALANNWLMLQYGWKPLLQDIHGSLQALKFLTNPKDFIQVVTAAASHEATSEKLFKLWQDSNISAGSEVTMTKTRCKIRLRYKIDDHLKSFLAQLGFTNPVNLAWEILPFSFVADWFFPLGPFLETLSSWDGLVFVDGSQTLFTRSEAVLAIDYRGKGVLQPLRTYEVTARRNRKTVLLDRSKLTSFPVSNIPSFKNGLSSVTHALNGLALLAKAFK